MKTFTFRYDPKASVSNMFEKFKSAVKTNNSSKHPNELYAKSIEAILSLMTAGRIELFYTIAKNKPDSLYGLAQALKRDPANVLRDVKTLASIGLISLLNEKSGARDRLKPIALYDRLVFDFGEAKQNDAA